MYGNDNGVWPALSSGFTSSISRPYREPAYPTWRVRVVRPFYVHGELVEVGAELGLPQPLAADLAAIGRVELLK